MLMVLLAVMSALLIIFAYKKRTKPTIETQTVLFDADNALLGSKQIESVDRPFEFAATAINDTQEISIDQASICESDAEVPIDLDDIA